MEPEINLTPPRDNLVRALADIEVRADNGDGPTLTGHFAVFNRWTEISSLFEGRFLERFSRSAFRKTITENRDRMKVLFQHGRDPQIGQKPLGAIRDLREDTKGVRYEVDLLDTDYVRELLPGLKAGLYGSSFQFSVVKEKVDQKPERSDYNPDGLPERTVLEARVAEFGAVTFPAYPDADAGARMRSLTDEVVEWTILSDPAWRARLGVADNTPEEIVRDTREVIDLRSDDLEVPVDDEPLVADDDTPPDEGDDPADREACEDDNESALQDALDESRQDATPASREDEAAQDNGNSGRGDEVLGINELRARQDEISARLTEIHGEYGADLLPPEVQSEWDDLDREQGDNKRAIENYEMRERRLLELAGDTRRVEQTNQPQNGHAPFYTGRDLRIPQNVFAIEEYRSLSRSGEELERAFRDGAMRVVENATFPVERIDREGVQSHIAHLLDHCDTHGEIAQRLITTGSPTYARAFGKIVAGRPLATEESRALSLADAAGGYAVPFTLDPTVIATSDGAINPIRQLARVETITNEEWKGITSEGITVTRSAEGDEAGESTPTLVQPTCKPTAVKAFVKFSIEVGQDWSSLQSEISRMLSDAKDAEEADVFTNGLGPTTVGEEPSGVISTLSSHATVLSATPNAFGIEDVYAVKADLPPRFRSRAAWLANDSIYSLIRQVDTSGGSSLWAQLREDRPGLLLGKPAYESSEMDNAAVSGAKILLIGDFQAGFLVCDRVGMSVELIPHLMGANRLPTGQRGFFAMWRNSSVILTWNAFRVLEVGMTS